MAKVSVNQVLKPVEYESEIRVEYISGGSSVVSQVSWENEDTISAMTRMFGVKSDERLAALIITKVGIKAEITTRK